MRTIEIIKTVRQEIRNLFKDAFSKMNLNLDPNQKKILLEVEKKGFCIIPNFYLKNEYTQNRNEIDKLIKKYQSQIVTDKEGSDHRIWGADRVSTLIQKFFANDFIGKIIKAHEQTDNITGFTLAARLEYKPDNLGSGGGWHRDWAVNKQIKAILYLSDVYTDSGPFQYVEGSHNHLDIIRDCFINNFKFNQNRFSDTEVEKIIKRNPSKLKTLSGKAGTLILVNTRGIHRGMPIKQGVRYALTNYYWSNMSIPSHLAEMIVKR